MRLAANLLIVACLCVGALSASTAYLVRIDGDEEQLQSLADQSLTLSQPAGIAPPQAGSSQAQPLLSKGTPLTLAALLQLRGEAADGSANSRQIVDTVAVKEFSLVRWRGKWMFLLSVVGMVAGALLLRRANKQGATPRAGSNDAVSSAKSPLVLLEESLRELRDVRSAVDQAGSEEQRLKLIVERLGRLQLSHLAPFVDSRDGLTRTLGLRRMAEILDGFSAAERQINRAWSAACDQHEEEARGCLTNAIELIQHPLEMLRGS